MYNSELDSAIIQKVKTLNSNQKGMVLDYLEEIPKMVHNTRIYRRKALKQIRSALNQQE